MSARNIVVAVLLLTLGCSSTHEDSASTGGAGGASGSGGGGSSGVGGTGTGAAAGTSGAAGSGTGAAAPVLPPCPADALVETTHANVPAGTYSVPVPAQLVPYASYEVGSINFCQSGDSVTLGYRLPELLLGKAEHVAFVGPWNASSETYELSGKDGTGSCARSGTTWTCTEHFSGLTVDPAKVSDLLKGAPPAELQGRVQVTNHFGQDPIGVLVFSLP